MLKYLRIAVMALCLTACVLLVALWVRSCRWTDVLTLRSADFDIGADSVAGGTAVFLYVDSGRSIATIDRGVFFESHDQRDWPDMPPPDRTWIFHVETTPNEVYAALPHWFFIAIAVLVGVAAWLGRFSVRTLLVAMTLVGVALGTLVAAGRF